MGEAYIVEAVRTAGGRRGGQLSNWHPVDMAGELLSALVDRSGIDPKAIDDVVMGCSSQLGEQSMGIGRYAVLASKLPETVPAVSVDRRCGSSQQALQFAAQAVLSGVQDVVIAAGVESMTRVPLGATVKLAVDAGLGLGPCSERVQKRFGVKEFSQFVGAQMIADKYGFTRVQLDEFSLESHLRAAAATEAGAFKKEILPLRAKDGTVADRDEGIRPDANMQALGSLKPLGEGGRLTAGSASQICDGAAGLLVMSENALKTHGLKPLARIHALTVTAGDPVMMLLEPVNATRRALQRGGVKIDDIDLYEVSEAFASVPMAWLQEIEADPARMNVNGGAIALGHPLGASGAKLMTTLVHALRARKKRWGLQTMCEGGGVANVTIIEALY
jgi:acetyl-CoA C-acetyltransferase